MSAAVSQRENIFSFLCIYETFSLTLQVWLDANVTLARLTYLKMNGFVNYYQFVRFLNLHKNRIKSPNYFSFGILISIQLNQASREQPIICYKIQQPVFIVQAPIRHIQRTNCPSPQKGHRSKYSDCQ